MQQQVHGKQLLLPADCRHYAAHLEEAGKMSGVVLLSRYCSCLSCCSVDPSRAHLAVRAPQPTAAEQAALLAAAKQAAQQGPQQQQQQQVAATTASKQQPKQQQTARKGKQPKQQQGERGNKPRGQQGRSGRSGAQQPVIVLDSDSSSSSSEGSGWDLDEGSEGLAAKAAATGGPDGTAATVAPPAAGGGGGTRDLSAGVYLYAMESGEPDPLHALQPVTVILYSPDLAWVRAAEVYQAERAVLLGTRVPPVQLVLLHYSPAPERDKFLAAASREADAFSGLIAAKQHVVLPVNSRPDNPMQVSGLVLVGWNGWGRACVRACDRGTAVFPGPSSLAIPLL
jgi:hypothetical protein